MICIIIQNNINYINGEKMRKIMSFIILIILSQNALAGPYITTKHEFKLKDSDYNKTVNQIRFGYDKKIKNSLEELAFHCEDMHVLGVYKAHEFREKK